MGETFLGHVAFTAARETGTVQWVMSNGAEVAVGIQGCAEQ